VSQKEKQPGLVKPTSQLINLQEQSDSSPEGQSGWLAIPEGTVEVSGPNGVTETITYAEWYSRLGVTNRGGT
jgi:hypothetical protein